MPEKEVVFRGKRFFDTFAFIKYEDMDKYIKKISESENTKKLFKNLFESIVK